MYTLSLFVSDIRKDNFSQLKLLTRRTRAPEPHRVCAQQILARLQRGRFRDFHKEFRRRRRQRTGEEEEGEEVSIHNSTWPIWRVRAWACHGLTHTYILPWHYKRHDSYTARVEHVQEHARGGGGRQLLLDFTTDLVSAAATWRGQCAIVGGDCCCHIRVSYG